MKMYILLFGIMLVLRHASGQEMKYYLNDSAFVLGHMSKTNFPVTESFPLGRSVIYLDSTSKDSLFVVEKSDSGYVWVTSIDDSCTIEYVIQNQVGISRKVVDNSGNMVWSQFEPQLNLYGMRTSCVYYPDGKIKSVSYSSSSTSQAEISWYNNGNLKSCYQYFNSLKEGMQVEYYENGSIKLLEYYKRGELQK